MRTVGNIIVGEDQVEYLQIDRRGNIAEKPALHCRGCGRRVDGSSMKTSPSVYWRWIDQDQRLIRAETGETSCREIAFSRIVDLGNYADEVREVRLLDFNVLANPTNQEAMLNDVANGLWLGLTDSVNRWVLDTSARNIIMPVEILDRRLGCGGPLFSICSYFHQVWESLNHPVGNSRYNPNGSLVQFTPTQMQDMGADLHELLRTQPVNYTPDWRRDVLREAVRVMWVGYDGRTNHGSEFHKWSKMAVLWHSMGGLEALLPELGFTYWNYSGHHRMYDTDGTSRRPEHIQCPHNTSGYRDTLFNGSLSFYSRYFNREIDGRTVTRFLNGGYGMMPETTNKYRVYKVWSA